MRKACADSTPPGKEADRRDCIKAAGSGRNSRGGDHRAEDRQKSGEAEFVVFPLGWRLCCYNPVMSDEPQLIIRIAPAAAADVPWVADMCLAVERQHEEYSPLRWSLRPDVSERYPQWLSRIITDPQWLVLCARVFERPDGPGELAGTVVANLMDEIPIYQCRRYAFIHEIAVLPEFRRHGVAKQLLVEVRHWAAGQGVSQVRLIAANKNPAAQSLFTAAGYQVTYLEMIQSASV